MKKRFVPAILAGLVLSGHAHAAGWILDKAHSTLGFTGSQSGTPFSGTFGNFDAAIDFDPQNPTAGHALVTIETASAITGDNQRDEAIPQPEWFDAMKFPQAKFEATGFKSLGGDKYEAIGTLSLRDIRKEVILPFTLTMAGNTATADGKLTLIRTEYGVGQGDWSTGQWVALQVDVTLHIVAIKN